MFYLVTGGSGSGKSEYAEDIVMSLKRTKSNLIYLATMIPQGEETLRKIARHHKLRAGKGFKTIECYKDLEKLTWKKDDIVLLECMSNLLADETFYNTEESPLDEDIRGRIIRGIQKIIDQAGALVVVTNEVFSDGISYDLETLSYINNLACLNVEMAKKADYITEVVYGIPVEIKRKD